MSEIPPAPTAPTPATVYPAVQHPQPAAIVVYCSDPRFQIAFEQFIAHELGLAKGAYMPVVVGGGAGVLGHPEQLPKEFKFLKERFETYRTIFPSIQRIVLINHEDCRYYATLKSKVMRFLGSSHFVPALQHAREDLPLVGDVFARLLSHLGVKMELYYARFADPDHNQIIFEKLDR